MGFDPHTDRYPYPEDTGAHYLVVKKNNGAVFDKDYPYADHSRPLRFKKAFMRALLRLIAFPVMRVRLGLRVKGRENLKKHREELAGGAVTCCNHVHLWDYLGVLYAIRPEKPWLLAWDVNMRGENASLIRMVGGIPIPLNDRHASVAFDRAVRGLLKDGEWLHIYSEGSMWEYYRPIRPFKDGTAYFACRCEKPILPLAFSYRRPGWIRRKIFRQIALFTLTVGEPIFPDLSLPRGKRVRDLTVKSHEAVCRLAGIDPEKNPYPPIYDRSTKIDYGEIPE